MKHETVAMVILLLFCCHGRSLTQTETDGEWFNRKPMPTSRQEMPAVLLDGKIYVLGGLVAGGGATNIVEVFDPATNSWSTGVPLPLRMHHLHVAVVNNKMYVLGGFETSRFVPSNRTLEFHPQTGEWETKANMPTARGAGAVAVVDGNIYVVGGATSISNFRERGLKANEVYNPTTDKWSVLADMPLEREHVAAVGIGSLLYVFGGRSQLLNVSLLQSYSRTTNEWTRLAFTTLGSGIAAAALHGKVYVFGGEVFFSDGSNAVYDHTNEYDPLTGLWTALAPMPVPRHGLGAIAAGDSIFVIGGGTQAGFSVSDVNSVFVPSGNPTSVLPSGGPVRGFALTQNYPNPFNPSTTIAYHLDAATHVMIQVYNVLGEHVRTFDLGTRPSGTYSVVWDGTDDSGGPLPSGLYLYQLQGRGLVETRKMLMIK